MTKQDQLNQLAAEIVSRGVCSDLAAQATQLVRGSGNVNADIVLIGEAPGKNEDQQGVPFIGAAGKVLNNIFAENKIVRDDIYITNIVKYRPPNNRDPKPAEKQAFWPYLVRELEIVAPKIIVPMGRHAMTYFLPTAIISEVHGKIFDWQGCKVMPLYHPAATLYRRDLLALLERDFAQLVQQIKQLKQ